LLPFPLVIHLAAIGAQESKLEIKRSTAVASTCDICGKGPSFGNNVSHSQVKTRRRWNPNIQRIKTLVGGTAKRQNVCTSCLKAGKVSR
jgi:large subunit ribosomal protein L28